MSVSGPNSAETTGRGQGGVGRALVLSCHPLPTVAVTAISAGLAALAGLSIGRAALPMACPLTATRAPLSGNPESDAMTVPEIVAVPTGMR